MIRSLVLVVVLACAALAAPVAPNVLFIAVDDLNDWVGWMGGHPQARTPHMDALAERGVRFTNAHCAYALCNPSRTSTLSGLLPTTTGVTGNQQDWRVAGTLRGHPMLPEVFREAGYDTMAAGKVFHANHGGPEGVLVGMHGGRQGFNHPAAWTERYPSHEVQIPDLAVRTGQNWNGLDIWHWDWGPLPTTDAATVDGRVVDWALTRMRRERERPWFLAVGIYAPHGPWYCPRACYEQHPLEGIELPVVKQDDLDDVPEVAKGYAKSPRSLHRRVVDAGLHKAAVQAYLAQISFADAMIGRLLEEVDWDRTVVVMWSDHGWYLGEKQRWHKGQLWEESTRVPLAIHAPGFTEPGGVCAAPVSLVDLYPTLLDVCGMPRRAGLDGRSLGPWLRDPARPRSVPVLTVMGGGDRTSFAARSDRWRYIRYHDGSEELYDHGKDPNEWENLAAREEYDVIKESLARVFPTNRVRAVRDPATAAWERRGKRTLMKGDELVGDLAPMLSGVGVEIEANFALQPGDDNAVLVGQGGSQHGYALLLRDRHPVFAVALDGKVTSLRAETALPARADGRAPATRLRAGIDGKGNIFLRVGEAEEATRAIGRATLKQPNEGLVVGGMTELARKVNGGATAFSGRLGEVTLRSFRVK